MKISDLLRLSFNNLKRRKGRTFLTVLGVVIGTCSIVLMVSIGVALEKSYDEMLQGWGDLTAIEVYKYGSSTDNDVKLTDAVVDSFLELPNVTVATPVYSPSVSLQVVSGNNDKYQAYAQIKAMRKSAIEAYGYEIVEGTMPSEHEKSFTVLFGEDYAYEFQNTKKKNNNYVSKYDVDADGNPPDPFVDPMHDKFYIVAKGWEEDSKEYRVQLNVSGRVKGDYSKGYETVYGMIMDIEDVIAIEKEYNKLNNIKTDKNKERTYTDAIVKVNDMKNVEDVERAIKAMGFETYSMSSTRDELKKETRIIEMILGGLGGIAMLVSAISIANTMTMAIYERTKEIGVMKVLGCELRDIKNMFLSEAAFIGFLGGATGLAISLAISKLLNTIAGSMMGGTKMSVIPPWLAIFSLCFATLVGIISGYIPAVRAVKITALSAIRHE
ncbi:MAG: ABC transporter permease [Oscillospiraceae bacterium]|nr:ABC transporter permease [Oscillospiraceae bacterium]